MLRQSGNQREWLLQLSVFSCQFSVNHSPPGEPVSAGQSLL